MAENTVTTNGRGDKLRNRIKLMNLELLFLRQNVQFLELLAADTVVNRLFFLQDTFEALSNPNYDEITFTPYGLYGFYEILKDMVEKAMDVTEIIRNLQGR